MSDPGIHPRVEVFAQDIAHYVRTHARWAEMSKEAAAREAILVALTDPSATPQLLDALHAQNGRSTDV